jgi:hypothetical protein
MKPNESAALTDDPDSLHRSVKLHLSIEHGENGRSSGRINDRVRRSARKASVFRPCTFEGSIDAINLFLR